jgi:hypothetical protein
MKRAMSHLQLPSCNWEVDYEFHVRDLKNHIIIYYHLKLEVAGWFREINEKIERTSIA